MTITPYPAEVEAVARAMYAYRDANTAHINGTEDWDNIPHAWRTEWCEMARTGIAAMPAPIGYAVTWCAEHIKHPHIRHPHIGHTPTSLRDAIADANEYRQSGIVAPTVVALVPVETDKQET